MQNHQLIGTVLGAALSEMFKRGGTKPKTERESKTNRQRLSRMSEAKSVLALASGGSVCGEQSDGEAIGALAIAWKFAKYLPAESRDPETIAALIEQISPEDGIRA